MGLEDIKKKIILDAEEKKKELIRQAEDKKKDVVSEFDEKIEAYRKSSLSVAKSEGESIKRGIIIDARQKLKNEMLAKKRSVMEEVFSKARESLINDKNYPEMMKNLALPEIKTGEEKIIISKDEKRLNADWLKSLNSAAKGKVSFSDEKGGFSGGLIIQDGNTYVNMTVETLINVMRESLEKAVADILF